MSGGGIQRKLSRLGGAALLACSGTATAQTIVPTQARICDQPDAQGVRAVNKERLATFLLDELKVSRAIEDWAASNRAGFETFTPRQRVILDPNLCQRAGACPNPAADAAKLNQARTVLRTLLGGQPDAYQNVTGTVSPRAFFEEPGARLICRSSETNPVVEAEGAIAEKFEVKIPIRIRGNADGLHFARNQSAFKAQEKAVISFGEDEIKKKTSVKFVGVAGWPIRLLGGTHDRYRTAELVPYIGINKDTSKTEGSAKSVTTDNWRLGAVLDYTTSASGMTHFLIARPEYIFNRKEKSEVASLNLTYFPVVNGYLNSYRYLVPGRDDLLSFRPILDVRFNNGTYTDRGLRGPSDSRDFSRIGGRIGVTLSSDIVALPADLTVTQIYLHGLAGEPDELSQFRAVFSLSLTADRLFGLDVSYVDGRREDLADKEEAWTIGLGLKF